MRERERKKVWIWKCERTKEDDLKEETKTEEFCFITHGVGGLRRAGRRFVD